MIGEGEVAGLKAALEAAGDVSAMPAWEVLDYVPEDLLPPAVVIELGEDFLTQDGGTFGEYRLNLDLYVLVELAGNEQATEDLAGYLAVVLGVLDRSVWSLDGMAKPGPFHSLNWLAHGTRLRISTETQL